MFELGMQSRKELDVCCQVSNLSVTVSSQHLTEGSRHDGIVRSPGHEMIAGKKEASPEPQKTCQSAVLLQTAWQAASA